jgi:ABC-type Fe3+-hydroxamate transport system substrate-binding protein
LTINYGFVVGKQMKQEKKLEAMEKALAHLQERIADQREEVANLPNPTAGCITVPVPTLMPPAQVSFTQLLNLNSDAFEPAQQQASPNIIGNLHERNEPQERRYLS